MNKTKTKSQKYYLRYLLLFKNLIFKLDLKFLPAQAGKIKNLNLLSGFRLLAFSFRLNKRILFLSVLSLVIVIASMFFLFKGTTVEANWYNQSWLYRKQLTFNNSAQSTNLSNFPVMVKLTSANFNFSQAQSAGQDIRFTDGDGTTALSYEIQKWDSSAQMAIIWVNVPQIDASSATDHIYIYWGNSTATDAQSADNTWNSNYKGVWHMDDNATSTTITDSSGNGNNITAGTNTNAGPYNASGNINGSLQSTGTPGYIMGQTASSAEVYPDIQVGSDNLPVIAYYDNNDTSLIVVKCNDQQCVGNDETLSVIDSTNTVGLYPSMKLDSNNYPMIAYYDSTNGDLKFVHCGNTSCSSGNTINIVHSTNTTGAYPDMELDASGYPVIAYQYNSGADLYLAHCADANCASATVSAVDTTNVYADNMNSISMKLDSSGYPVIAYDDETADDVKIAHCNDANCAGGDESITNPVATNDAGDYVSLLLETGTGNPLIAYYDNTLTDQIYLKCDDVNCTGAETASVTLTVDAGSSANQMTYDASGRVVIFYQRSVYPRIAVCATTACSSITETYLTLYNQYGIFSPKLDTDESGNLYLVDYSYGKSGTYDVNFYTTYKKAEQAYDADFDFGTGSFSVSGWLKSSNAKENVFLSRYDADQGFKLSLDYAGRPCFAIDDDSSFGPDDEACAVGENQSYNVDSNQASSPNTADMELDTSGYPVIAYFDASAALDLELIHCNDVNCAGANETTASIDTTGDTGRNPSIELDGSGFPVIAYHDNTNNDLKVVHCGNANCSSGNTVNTVDGDGVGTASSNDVGDYPTVKLDGSGYPVILYTDETNDDVRLMHCNDVNCSGDDETINVISSTGNVRTMQGTEALAINGSGNPIAIYHDTTNADIEYIACNDANCDGTGETNVSIDAALSVYFGSLKLDSAGKPVMAYYNGSFGVLRVSKCSDQTCSSVTSNNVAIANNGFAGYFAVDLELTSSNYPVISHSPLSYFSTAVTVCNDEYCTGNDETSSVIYAGDAYSYLNSSVELDSNQYPVFVFCTSSADIKMIHFDNATSYTDGNAVDDGQWHHFTAVKNATTSIKMYIDGVEVASDTSIAATGTLTSDSATLNLFEDLTSGYSMANFGGQLDEIQIDNTARSADWIKAQYLSESDTFINVATITEIRGKPNLWLALDEGFGQTLNDGSGKQANGTLGADGSASSDDPTWVSEEMCVSGKCLQFDGSADYINVASDVTDVKSVSFWVRPNTTSEYFIDLNGSAYIQSVSGTISATGFTSPTIYVDGIPKSTLEANKWQHIEVTTSTPLLASAITVGKVSTNYLQGFMDDIKLYSYTRSASQVKQDFNTRGVGGIQGSSASFGGGNISENLSEGLVGYWKMDEATGTTVSDASGNGGTLTFGASAPTWVSGKYGYATSYDGTNSVGTVPDSTALDISGDTVTLGAWIYVTAYAPVYGVIIQKNGYADGFRLAINSTGKIYSDMKATERFITGTNIVPLNTWTHVGVVYDGRASKMYTYINGVLDNAKVVTSGNLSTNNSVLTFGKTEYPPITGYSDEVRIYNRALSEAEVRALYNFAPSPVGYWKLDENTGITANDTSGNAYTGTISGSANYTSGKFGSAVNFDGTDDYVSTAASVKTLNNFSISTWLKADSTAYARHILYEGLTGSNGWGNGATMTQQEMHLSIGNATGGVGVNDKLSFFLGDTDDAFSTDTLQIATDFSDISGWHYVTVNVTNLDSSPYAEMYLDGVKVGSDTGTTTRTVRSSWDTNFQIGKPGTSTRYFDGKLDDIKIYNYARTTAQIVQDMNAGHPAPGSPVGSAVAYYKFDEGYGDTANNSGNGGSGVNGNLAGTCPGGATCPTWSTSGKNGKAMNFDGSDDYIDVPDSTYTDFTGDMTVSMWINPGTTQKQYADIFSKHSNGGYSLEQNSNSTNQYQFMWDRTGGGVFEGGGVTTTLTANVWQHFVIVKNGTLLFHYLNGKQTNRATATSATISTNSLPLRIGNWSSTSGRQWKGLLDDLKFYNFALTEDQIKTEFNQGKAQVIGSLGTTAAGVPDNSDARKYCPPGDTTASCAPIAHWKLDERSGTIAYDSSGRGNSSTAFGATTTWANGKYGSGVSCIPNSATCSITVTNNDIKFNYTDSFTLQAWIKKNTANPSNYMAAFSQQGSSGKFSYHLMHNSGTDQECAWITKSGTGSDGVCSSIPANTWVHHTMVYNGSTQIVSQYIDGVFKGSTAWTRGSVTAADSTALIANDSGQTSTRSWDGTVDDIRIYNYPRTPAQISWDYNKGAPVAWYKFDECTGTTIYNSARNANGDAAGMNGTLSLGASPSAGTCTTSGAWYNGVSGKLSSSMDFDGTDDVVTITNADALDFDTGLKNAMSYAFWVYPNTDGEADTGEIFDKGTNTYCRTDSQGTTDIDLECQIDLGTADANLNIADGLTANTWNHVVVTYTDDADDELTVYINGVNKGASTAGNGAPATTDTSDLLIGGSTSTNFDGQIDDFRLYNYELTQQQVRDVYNNGAVSFK